MQKFTVDSTVLVYLYLLDCTATYVAVAIVPSSLWTCYVGHDGRWIDARVRDASKVMTWDDVSMWS